jgi:hypothetical protein
MAKASNTSKMVITIKVLIKKASQMVLEDMHGKTVAFIRVNSLMATDRVRVSCTRKMAVSTKVIQLVC